MLPDVDPATFATRVLADDGPGGIDHPANEMVLDIPDGIGRDGGDVQLFAFNGGANQHWAVQPVEDVDAFLIISVLPGLVLDVPGFTAADQPIQQFDYNGGPNQLWQLLDANGQPYIPFTDAGEGPGPFTIVSLSTGKTLHLDAQGLLAQTEPTGGDDQQWLAIIREFPTGLDAESAWLIQHQSTGLVLTEVSRVAGAGVGAQADAGGDRTQAWWFTRSGEHLFQSGIWPPV
ncbi:RICIN domain-containing protein [Specibacter cremeus]|uniref:RICIN domain-containing protein n=1 Tax=Specibacter cremeus TaxID=1629051 RepID=UPI000F7AE572|nr:RICIN domain-containing protein [Specibacter cremeus]